MEERNKNRMIVYQEILISRILKASDRFTYEDLKTMDIEQIEMLIYDHNMSTYISEEEIHEFEKNKV